MSDPGSQEAIERGCTCQWFGPESAVLSLRRLTTGCPVHDPKERDA